MSQARSFPGQAVPPDSDESVFISPSVSIRTEALTDLMPGGVPIVLPSEHPQPSPVPPSGLEAMLQTFDNSQEPLSPADVGEHRLFLLEQLAQLPEDDVPVDDETTFAIANTSLLAWQAARSMSMRNPRPNVLWNEEMNAAQFISRTILLADHVLSPDKLVMAAMRGSSRRTIRGIARSELSFGDLVKSGRVLMVPAGLEEYLRSDDLLETTLRDLSNVSLTNFVSNQLVIEGPTAREALFIRAIDDESSQPYLWMYGRIIPKSVTSGGEFQSKLLGEYDGRHDYQPWIDQSKRSAISKYIQRTVGRLSVAEALGAEYVATSPFEARMLRLRHPSALGGVASASVWAEVPSLSNLESKDLAKLLANDDAVEDLRSKVRATVASTEDFVGRVQSVREFAAEIEYSADKLQRKMQTERAYSGIAPALLGSAGVLIGATAGGYGLLGGVLGALTSLPPYLGGRVQNRREASYLLVTARRTRRH